MEKKEWGREGDIERGEDICGERKEGREGEKRILGLGFFLENN